MTPLFLEATECMQKVLETLKDLKVISISELHSYKNG